MKIINCQGIHEQQHNIVSRYYIIILDDNSWFKRNNKSLVKLNSRLSCPQNYHINVLLIFKTEYQLKGVPKLMQHFN